MGFVEVEFVVVHVLIDAHVFTKSAYSPKTESSQFRMLWLVFGP